MADFCAAQPTNPLCACIVPQNNIIFPECMDKRCKDTNAMKTSAMLNNQCDGVKVTFLMYITI